MQNPPHPPALKRPLWTPAKQRIFLAALMETGSVSAAATAAGMSRSSANRLRARLAGTPFDQTWTQALRHHGAQLADPFGTRASAAQPRGDTAAKPARR